MKTKDAKYYERKLKILGNVWIGFGVFLLAIADILFIIGLIQFSR